MDKEIEIEQFNKCPKCGYEPETKGKAKIVSPVYHYVCSSCGYEESGTASMPANELIKNIKK